MARFIMRTCRNPSCAKGEFPSSTARAAYCSSACRLIHHRQKKKQQTHIEEAPMSKTSQLFQPDPQQIQSLKDFAEKQYRQEVECLIQGREKKGIYAEFLIESLQATLDRYAELKKQGFKASPLVAHVPQLVQGVTNDWITLTLVKPDAVVAEEIAAIHAAEESAYLVRLSEMREAAVAKEVQSLLDRERGKRQQAEQEAKAAKEAEEYARVEAEVLQALGLGEKQ